jgi:hypothetical protein
MIKPNMPNIPGIGAMNDTLDFVKNLWGNMGLPGMTGMNIPGMPGMSGSSFNIPGMVMPTLSVEEINKKITDLKAVESWLALNMNMLRGTIQALEVQAATISTLKTMGESFTSTMSSMNPVAAAAGKHDEAPATASDSGEAHANGNGADGSAATSARRSKSRAPEPTKKDEQDAASLTAPLVNAAAWWNMLQDQFKQAVGTAMASEEAEEKTASATKPSKPKSKTAASAASATGSTGTTTRKRKTSK